MPKRCNAAGCSTSNGGGYIAGLHAFLRYESIYTYERNGDGPTAYPVRLKHFETISLLSKAQVTDICTRNSSKEAA